MGNKPLENSDYDGNRTNRSMVSIESKKLITSMLQRVHTQMENEQTSSVNSNEKSAIKSLKTSKVSNKQEFADTQQLFQNNINENEDDFGVENYFSANEHNETNPSLIKAKDHFSNVGPSFAINSILSKNVTGKSVHIHIPRINCDLQKSLFSLPNEVIYIILSFLIDNYNTLTSISPVWYYKINEVMEESLVSVDNDFIKTHMEFLSLKKSYFSITPLKLSKVGFRLDRNIVAEVFPCLEAKTVILRYYYESKNKTNCSEFHFDAVKKNNRKIWIYKENFKHNYDKNKIGFVQPIIPIFNGDNIKIAINFYNPKGLIDIKKIRWDSPIIEDIPKIPKNLNTKSIKSRFELDRLCELETIHAYDQWIDPKYLDSMGGVLWDLNKFEPQLKFLEIKSAGIDTGIISNRITYKAMQCGLVEDSYDIFGVNLEVLPENDECITEVKRYGLVFDLEEDLQLKSGDVLVFYVSGGA